MKAKLLKHLAATLLAMGLVSPVIAADYRIDSHGRVVNDQVMYAIGGGSVVGGSTTRMRPSSIGIGISWKSNFMCGNFDLKTTVRNQLNGAVEGFKDMMGDILNAAVGAVSSLPAVILQRANPGIYELITNGIMQARLDFDRSKLTCENMANRMVDLAQSNRWGELSNGQFFMDLVGQNGNQKLDAVQTMKDVEKNNGDAGVSFVGGEKKGGKGQEPILATKDIVQAGYNALHRRDVKNLGPISVTSCDGGAICRVWPTPDDASKFAEEVLGETAIRLCSDCDPKTTKVGVGLTPIVEREYNTRMTELTELVLGTKKPTAENLAKVSSDMLPVTRKVIEALQYSPDRDLMTRRLASEVALSRVLEQALLLKRLLIAGARNPHVQQTTAIDPDLQKNMETLDAEIEMLMLDMNVRKTVNAQSTIFEALREHTEQMGVSEGVKLESDPERDRLKRTFGKDGQ